MPRVIHSDGSVIGRVALIVLLACAASACGSDDSLATRGKSSSASGSSKNDDDDGDDDAPASSKPARDAGKATAVDAGHAKDAKVASSDGAGAKEGAKMDAARGTGSAGADAFCGVLAIAQTKCSECHGQEIAFGAPMSLATYEDFVASAPVTKDKKVFEQIGARIHDTTHPMPPAGQPTLTADELAKLDAWIAAGAPAPSTACASVDAGTPTDTEVEVTDWPEDCEEHHKFLANDNGQPHAVRAGYEGYDDFYFELPWKDSVQGVAFRPIIDNKKVIHHWILYQGQASFLNGWSPGKPEKQFPTDWGVYLPPGGSGQLKLESHYNNKSSGAKDEVDQSGVEICITRHPRKHTAFTFPFTASASAPAGQTVSNENSCTVQTDQDVHLVTSSPHMHKLGVHAKFEVIRTSGERITMTDKPFDFNEQTDQVIDVVLHTGDKVSVTCTYKNDSSRNVAFGLTTEDEMCFNFSLYYPMCGMTCTGGDPLAAAISLTQGGGCPGL